MGDDNFYIFKIFLQAGPVKKKYFEGQRPPYPIIIDKPRMRDAFMNMGLPEYMPLIITFPLSLPFAYYFSLSRYYSPQIRARTFYFIWLGYSSFAFYLGLRGSAHKLMGFKDNGLKWKRPDTRLKKYDFTEELYDSAWYRFWIRKGVENSRAY